MVRRRVDSRMEMSSFSETAVLVDKRHHLVIGRHEIGAAMSGDHDGPAGIAQPRRLVPVPAAQMAKQKARRKRIAGTQNIGDLHRESGYIDGCRGLHRTAQMDPCTVGAAL